MTPLVERAKTEGGRVRSRTPQAVVCPKQMRQETRDTTRTYEGQGRRICIFGATVDCPCPEMNRVGFGQVRH